MTEKTPATVALRDAERKEIEAQIKAFLQKGGKIEQIPLAASAYKHVGKAGHAGFGALDGF